MRYDADNDGTMQLIGWRCQVNEQRAHFAASDGAACDSRETRHCVPIGERSRTEQPVVSGGEQVATDPEEIVHNAVN